MENPLQHVASAAAIASGIITDAGPQFWKVTLNSGKVKPPLKNTLFEGVKIYIYIKIKMDLNFSSASAIHVTRTFCKKRRPGM